MRTRAFATGLLGGDKRQNRPIIGHTQETEKEKGKKEERKKERKKITIRPLVLVLTRYPYDDDD